MSVVDIKGLSAYELGHEIKEGNLSCVETTEYFLKSAKDDFAKASDDSTKVNAYISIDEEGALASAAVSDEKRSKGENRSLLEGIPMVVKDNICLEGAPTTAASKILENFVPPYTATVCEKLEQAGAVVLGKANMDEFAMGSSNETSYFGIVRNPWDKTAVPGGSSGGSASAVAAGLAAYAIGSDTGGSIRQPAAFTGTTGLKPTYGSVSRYGLMAYASSLDQIGPIAHDARDCALVYQAIAGTDKKDSTSVSDAINKVYNPEKIAQPHEAFDLKGIKIGIPANYFKEGLSSEVADAVKAAAEDFKSLGAIVDEFELPLIEYAVPTYLIVACAEASSNLSRYDGVKYGYRSPEAKNIIDEYYLSRSEGFGTEVKRRIMLGSFVLSSGYFDAYYKKALKVRGLIRSEFVKALSSYDLILSPVTPTTAFKIGGQIDDPLAMYLSDIYTVSVNLAGVPALALPCGFDTAGLPIGMQLIGRDFDEGRIFEVADSYQNITDYHKRRPSL
jgi:aspartyl-tRNA(Asn)/glutamyl-tRNA(Gln) amidotransferase subunit A